MQHEPTATPTSGRISLDRATVIAHAAVDVGLASWEQERDDALSMTPALREFLTDVGVTKLAELSPTQAQAVEAFIARRA